MSMITSLFTHIVGPAVAVKPVTRHEAMQPGVFRNTGFDFEPYLGS